MNVQVSAPHRGRSLRIVICDSQELVREALKELLARGLEGAEIATCVNAGHGIDAATKGDADILVFDVPDSSLRECVRLLEIVRRGCPRTALLLVTAHGQPSWLRRFLASGIDGCMLQQEDSEVLLAAVQALASDSPYVSPAVTRRVKQAADPSAMRQPAALSGVSVGHAGRYA